MIFRMHRFILLSIFVATGSTQAAELAGRVIMVRGQAEAISVTGDIRTLKRRDSVYVSDVLRTGADSKVQIRFIDNALLALKADTELRISTYDVNQDAEGGTILMELIEGGFRTLTGSIGKGDKSDYEVRTPVASIGIRGTLYSILFQQQELLAGVWEGGIGLTSDLGQFELGSGADFNFAVLNKEGFNGLLTPPTELQESTPRTVARSQQINRSQSSEDQGNKIGKSQKESTSESLANEDGTLATVEIDEMSASSVLGKAPSGIDSTAVDGTDTDGNSLTSAAGTDGNTDAGENNSQTELVLVDNITILIEKVEACQAEGSSVLDCIGKDNSLPTNPDPTDPVDPDIPTSADLRLSDLEYQALLSSDRVGAVVGDGEQRGGAVIQLGNGEPVFFVYNEREDRREVVRYDGVSSVHQEPLPGIDWGIWSGTAEQPVKAYTDGSNPDVFETREDKVLWVSATPIRSSDLAGLYGTVSFSSDAPGAAALGFDSKGQDLAAVDGQFTLNFDTGQISDGQLDALFGVDRWKIEFDGNIRVDDQNTALVNMSLLRGQSSNGVINVENSEFGGILQAPDADAFIGTFSLQDASNATANGAVVWPLLNSNR